MTDPTTKFLYDYRAWGIRCQPFIHLGQVILNGRRFAARRARPGIVLKCFSTARAFMRKWVGLTALRACGSGNRGRGPTSDADPRLMRRWKHAFGAFGRPRRDLALALRTRNECHPSSVPRASSPESRDRRIAPVHPLWLWSLASVWTHCSACRLHGSVS